MAILFRKIKNIFSALPAVFKKNKNKWKHIKSKEFAILKANKLYFWVPFTLSSYRNCTSRRKKKFLIKLSLVRDHYKREKLN